MSPSTDFSNKAEDREVPETVESCAQKVGNMPVFEVTVTRNTSVTDSVLVHADDAGEASLIAQDIAGEWDYDTVQTDVDNVRELDADETLASAHEVITSG